jgi:hypothetical protein
MRIYSNNNEYIGTPQELKDFFNNKIEQAQSNFDSYTQDEFAPLEQTISESEALRHKLAKDPSYNPFGGVIAGNEPDLRDSSSTVSADIDTGVELK